jgi:hypothetical protein
LIRSTSIAVQVDIGAPRFTRPSGQSKDWPCGIPAAIPLGWRTPRRCAFFKGHCGRAAFWTSAFVRLRRDAAAALRRFFQRHGNCAKVGWNCHNCATQVVPRPLLLCHAVANGTGFAPRFLAKE